MMKITNGLDTTSLENVDISVNFKNEAGNAIRATSDPNDTTASFLIRVNTMDGINDVSGNGSVAPATIAEIHWLIIPAPGAGGTVPTGKLYYVGATLNYSVGGKAETVEVTPDFLFDANSPGIYSLALATPPNAPHLPPIQFISDRTVNEGEEENFQGL